MAFAMNTLTVGGYLTKAPEVRYSRAGEAWCTATVAVNDGKKGTEAQFVPIKAFGKTAELIGEHYGKGAPILLTGRIQQERWESEEGDPRSRLVVVVGRLVFLPLPPREAPEETASIDKPPKKGRRK